jgi:hypothetical protein
MVVGRLADLSRRKVKEHVGDTSHILSFSLVLLIIYVCVANLVVAVGFSFLLYTCIAFLSKGWQFTEIVYAYPLASPT